MIRRYYADDETPSELEQAAHAATLATLAAAGWTPDPANSEVIIGPDGERRWFTFGFEEQAITEPEVGTAVEVHAEGCWRTGKVIYQGPGFFVAEWAYKSGQRGTSSVINGDPYRVVVR